MQRVWQPRPTSLLQHVCLNFSCLSCCSLKIEFDKWQEGLSSRIEVCNLNALKDKDERRAMIRKWERGDLNPSEWSGVLLATEGVLKNCLENTRTLASCLTPDVLVLDEAHTLICTATKRYEMLQSIAPRRIVGMDA
jgi:hypothetical protein